MCSYSHRNGLQPLRWGAGPPQAGGALAGISRLKARHRLGVSEMQLLTAEAQRHRLPSLPCMQGAGCGRESLNEWLPAPLVELHLSCVPGDGCDLGLHLGCDFLSGFLNCLCSVRVSEGLGVPGGVFVFQSEYGRCLSPSLSLPFPKYVPYVSVHALLTSVCVMWSETSGLKMASVFLPDQTCSCRVRTKWDKLCPISIFFAFALLTSASSVFSFVCQG